MLTNTEVRSQKPLSLRAYGRRRGTSVTSVWRAVRSGRLEKSLVTVNGKVRIGDPDLADQEWERNTDLTKAPTAVKEAAAERQAAMAVTTPVTPATAVTVSIPDGLSLADAAAEEKRWKARQAELDFRREAGELVNAEAWASMAIEEAIRVRTKIMAVPNKFKQRAPEVGHAAIRILDDLLRQALEDLATDDKATKERGAA